MNSGSGSDKGLQ